MFPEPWKIDNIGEIEIDDHEEVYFSLGCKPGNT